MGNGLGILGVSFGVAATLGLVNFPHDVLIQWALMVALGGSIGTAVA